MHLAVFQSAGGGLSLDERLSRLDQAIAKSRLDLVLCPELFASGYNVGDALKSQAAPPTGFFFEQVAQIARKYRTAIVFGYPESGENALYNSTAFVSADGELLANHRKQLNSPGSFEEDYFTPGNKATLLTYQGLKFAFLICYEVEFPEAVRNVALQGAQVALVPTALVDQWDVVATRVVPARAFENGIWLAYANHAGHENGFDYLGGSKIVAPDGVIEADAGSAETLIATEIDPERVTAAQARLPYLRDHKKYLQQ